MTLFSRVCSWSRSLFRRARFEGDMDAELRAHIEAYAEDLIRRGISREEAQRRARMEFGGMERVKEECRESRGIHFAQTLFRDVRYGMRVLRRTAVVSAIAVLTIALGIGVSTAIFSLVDSVLLRPLPFPNSDKIARIWGSNDATDTRSRGVSAAEFLDYRHLNRTMSSVAAFQNPSFTFNSKDHATLIWGERVSAAIFKVLGMDPKWGRAFQDTEELPGHNHVAVLGYRFWQEQFGGNLSVLGSQITLDDKPYTVIGIMPPDFYTVEGIRSLSYRDDVLIPLSFEPTELQQRDVADFEMAGRLKKGAGIAQARAEAQVLTKQFRQQFPNIYSPSEKWSLGVESAHDYVFGKSRTPLLLLWGAAMLVLLIACTNVASLLLARVLARQNEIKLRVYLGARRSDLVRMVVVEGSLLGLAGCGAGIVLANYSLKLFRILRLFDTPGAADALKQSTMNSHALAFAVFAAAVTVAAASIAAAVHILRKDSFDSMSEARQTQTHARVTAQKTLVAVQIGIAMVLVVGAALVTASFMHVLNEKLGLDPYNVLQAWISLPQTRYAKSSEQAAFFNRLLDEVTSAPGVEAAGIAIYPPLWGKGPEVHFARTIEASRQANHPTALFRVVSPGYFAALRIPFASGRNFTKEDNLQHPPVFIVNESLAKEYFAGQRAIGGALTIGGHPGDYLPLTHGQIVGIVADSKYGITEDKHLPQIFMTFLQSPSLWGNVYVRTKTDPASMFSTLERKVWDVDKDQAVLLPDAATLQALVSHLQSNERLLATLFLTFGGLALFMATIGIYAITYFNVHQRTSEFGIRMALGAQPADILRLALAYGLKLVLLGSIPGIAVALALTRLLESILYHVRPGDPFTIGTAIGVLILVCLLACYIPARRAMKVDPTVALRHE